MEEKKPTMELNEEDAIVFAHFIAKVPMSETIKATGYSESTINRRRGLIKKFMSKSFNLGNFQSRIMGLMPLVIHNLTHFLIKKDKEITLKFAQSFGLLFKDNEGLEKFLSAIAGANSSQQPATGDNYYIGNIYNGLSTEDKEKHDGNLAAILNGNGKASRFSNN